MSRDGLVSTPRESPAPERSEQVLRPSRGGRAVNHRAISLSRMGSTEDPVKTPRFARPPRNGAGGLDSVLGRPQRAPARWPGNL
jgi:hypothetical protein